MMIKFYGYKKCDTSRKGEKALQDLGVEYEFIDVTLTPPSKTTLKKIIKQSGEDTKKFFNTSGIVYKELKMKDKLPSMSENEIIDTLSENGKLIKRPIVTDGEKATVGFQPETFKHTWSS
ncbi:MAG: Spx/MgsR family RNA polymerase-binding regulatory protein [Leptospiraceae bacterium]|nr:Spx/MgsR family RNA polymerase-binding regulatory protein [Leptospiraceae bacterium]